jgi:DNA-binding NarL/FixJ family response regulator
MLRLQKARNVKPRLLIVDDNSILRKTIRDILESKFPTLRVFEAADGKEAFIQIRNHLPNLILMDIRLAKENGLELTREIKSLYPQIVVIIFTNYDLPEYRAAAFENGADFFYSKSSSNRQKLTAMVKSILADAGSKKL